MGWWRIAAVPLGVLVVACGDDPVPGSTGAGLARGPDDLAVQIRVWEYWLPPLENLPLEGAAVAIDFGPERLERTTNQDGVAVFERIELARVTGLVAVADGHAFAAYSGEFVRDRSEALGSPLPVWIRPLGDQRYPDLVTVSGTATHVAGGSIVVSASEPGQLARESDAHWSLQVPRDKPFTLFAADIDWTGDKEGLWQAGTEEQVYAAPVPALHADKTLPIAFDPSAPPFMKTAKGSFLLAPYPDLRNHGTHAAFVGTFAAGATQGYLGGAFSLQRSDDGDRAEFTASWMDVKDFDIRTEYSAFKDFANNSGPEYAAWVIDDGPPRNEEGFDPGFLSPPDPELDGSAHAIAEPLHFENSGLPPDVTSLFVSDAEGLPLGVLYVSGDEREFTFPRLPGSVDLAERLPGTVLGFLSCGVYIDERNSRKRAFGPLFVLVP